MITQKCRVCGCTERDPCDEGCCWVEYDLCSVCAERLDEAARAVIRWEAMREAAARLIQASDEAKRFAIEKLRVCGKNLTIAGVTYHAVPSRQEIQIRALPKRRRSSK